MKRFISVLLLLATCATLFAKVNWQFTEASDLTLVGKIMDGTPNPYHRVDTLKYKGFDKTENFQVRCPAGMAVVFETNSTALSVKTEYVGKPHVSNNTMGIAERGYDLYIQKDGKWIWAASGCYKKQTDQNVVLIENMDGEYKTCMLYFPLYVEVNSVQIGVQEEACINKIKSPFRHRIAIWGSSFTHGISTSRPGMSYPKQFERRTGLQVLALGCSGHCKLQPYFADVLCDVDAEAFIFDTFSNPNVKEIGERLEPFIQKLTAAHPGKPLIFQQTIYRERRNFSTKWDRREAQKMQFVEDMMKEMCNKYKDVHFIVPNACDETHEFSVDGTHPDNYGYMLWERSIEQPVLDILAKYGIK